MKNANVVQVRDLGPLTEIDAAGLDHDSGRVDRMADLLRRYPHVDEAEKAEILEFLKRGRQLEVGLVSAREGISARMMQFRKDHRAHFRLTPLQMLGFAALVLVPLLALAWACFG